MAQAMMKDLNKKYDEVHAVKDVNLHIRDKEFIVLVGPSGCGKSTTLRMVAGLEEITAGEITIGDRIVNDLPPKDRDIAMVFQNYALYPHMTVYDNMAFGLKMRKFPNRFVAGFIGSPSMNFADVTVADASGALWVETVGLRVKVPPAIAGRLGAYKSQHVTLGIRPEDLRVASGSDSADYSFDTVVEVVEPLGSEILLDLKAGPNVIVARVEPTVRVKHSDKLRLALHPERVRFFDNKTELAI